MFYSTCNHVLYAQDFSRNHGLRHKKKLLASDFANLMSVGFKFHKFCVDLQRYKLEIFHVRLLRLIGKQRRLM